MRWLVVGFALIAAAIVAFVALTPQAMSFGACGVRGLDAIPSCEEGMATQARQAYVAMGVLVAGCAIGAVLAVVGPLRRLRVPGDRRHEGVGGQALR